MSKEELIKKWKELYDSTDSIYKDDKIDKLFVETIHIIENYGDPNSVAYEKGLEDAWELVRRIFNLPNEGGYTNTVIDEIFGDGEGMVINRMTAREALDMEAAYRKKKEKKPLTISDIAVGDILRHSKYGIILVVKIDKTPVIHVIDSNGEFFGILVGSLSKTGRHINVRGDIEKILDRLKECEQNE